MDNYKTKFTELGIDEKLLPKLENAQVPLEEIFRQLNLFKNGIPPVDLIRSAGLNDGIIKIDKNSFEHYLKIHKEAEADGIFMKFVPASGAATRMFKSLIAVSNSDKDISFNGIRTIADTGDKDFEETLLFFNELRKFAFYPSLENEFNFLSKKEIKELTNNEVKQILKFILTDEGLDYQNLPKAAIEFHTYKDEVRTSFEEQIIEAINYTKNKNTEVKIHFTISENHKSLFEELSSQMISKYSEQGIKLNISFSQQNPATDTIAVDLDNNPFLDNDNKLVFRPGGHGALLENLSNCKGNIVFIKNIDNVVPDRLKEPTYLYKKILGALLVELQDKVFGYCNTIERGDWTEETLIEIKEFLEVKFNLVFEENFNSKNSEFWKDFLFKILNRPLRVCGLVKNEGEPGGGPFWVSDPDGNVSLQVVEEAQVNKSIPDQVNVYKSSTHFSPTDFICSLIDYNGEPFNLNNFRDDNTAFITNKSKDGKTLKALELPGLWNGSMALWNSVFVEIPNETFNPVKVITDLIKDVHQ